MVNLNRKPNFKLMRVGIDFDKIVSEMQNKRITNGVADARHRETNSTNKLTELMSKHKLFPQIKKDLEIIKFKELREGLI